MNKYKIITLGLAAGFILMSDLQATRLQIPHGVAAGTQIGDLRIEHWPSVETATRLFKANEFTTFGPSLNALLEFVKKAENLHGVPQDATDRQTWNIIDAMRANRGRRSYEAVLRDCWHDAETRYETYQNEELVNRITELETQAAAIDSEEEGQAVPGFSHQASVQLKRKANREEVAKGWALTTLLNDAIDATEINVGAYSLVAENGEAQAKRAKAIAKLNELFGDGNKWASGRSKDSAATVIATLISRTLGAEHAGNLAACVPAGSQLDGNGFGAGGGGQADVPAEPNSANGFYADTELPKAATDQLVGDLMGGFQNADFGAGEQAQKGKFLILCQALPKPIRNALRENGVIAA